MQNIILTFLSAVSYYFYNKMYFRLVCNIQHITDQKKKWVLISFIINFTIFFICSMLKFDLFYNWLIFSFFIFLETYFMFKSNFRNATFLTLQGTICGLTANIFNRCVLAIVLNKNLIAFANDPMADGNIKGIPIIFGFFSTAVVFYIYSKENTCKQLNTLLKYPKHMMFLLKIMVVMMTCLLVQLLLYNYDANDLILKLWGLLSILFVMIGYLLGLNYIIRLCELEWIKDENEKLRVLVKSQRELEEVLSKTVYLDELTGFYNRQFADNRIQKLFNENTQFILCFIDLNKLKYVNDKLGHSAGDYYILEVSRELASICKVPENRFRYGGDEFVLIFQKISKQHVMSLLDNINQHLSEVTLLFDMQFCMSISYGAVMSDEHDSVSSLITKADSLMYEQKQRMYNKQA